MTTLRFPSRITVELVEGEDPSPVVAATTDAYAAALDRAVGRAETLHLVRDAHAVELPQVHIDFRGDAVGADGRARLAEGVTTTIAERVAGLLARPQPTGSTREDGRPGADAWELGRMIAAFDPAADTYLVPGYGNGGAPVAIPLQGGAGDVGATGQATVVSERRLWEFTSWWEAGRLIVAHYRGTPPSPVVAVFSQHGKPHGWLVQLADGAISSASYLGAWVAYTPPTDAGPARAHAMALADDSDAVELERVAGTLEERLAGRVEQIMLFARRHVTASLPESALRAAAVQLARQRPDSGRPSRFYRLLAGSRELALLEVDETALLPDRCAVAVLTEVVRVARDGVDEHDDVIATLPLGELLRFTPDPTRPFLAEPPVEYWPPGIAAQLIQLMSRVAEPLGMVPGRYPGMFVLAALDHVNARCQDLGRLASGSVDASPRFAVISVMAGAYDAVDVLQSFYQGVLFEAERGHSLPPMLRHNVAEWVLHFVEKYTDLIDTSVRAMFVATCQDILLGVLEESGRQLAARLAHFDAYMRVTRVLVSLMLVQEPELTRLRERLLRPEGDGTGAGAYADVPDAGVMTDASAPPVTAPPIATGTSSTDTSGGSGTAPATDRAGAAWWSSSQLVVEATRRAPAPTAADTTAPESGRLRWTDSGAEVQDSTGRWWTRQQIDVALSGARREALAIDPMLEKLDNLPDAVEQLRSAGPNGIDDQFRRLIGELIELNRTKTAEARADPSIAFGLATVQSADRVEDEVLGARLFGIHHEADEALTDLFTGRGADLYVQGLRDLTGSELGLQAFETFFNLVGLVAIAILCPPAAFAIGAAEALVALDTALEHRELQRAMLGGEDILSRSQVEAELWGAAIGVALAFLPEVGTIARGAARGARAVIRGEIREGLAVAGQSAARRAAAHIAENAARGLVSVFVRDCMTAAVLNYALEHAIGRFTHAIAHEVEVAGRVSVLDLDRLAGDALAGVGSEEQ